MVRDEAHRFALTRSRSQRQRSTLRSRLDDLPGIGPKRRRELLRHFGSLKGVAAASEAELREVVGPKLAAVIASSLASAPGQTPAVPG
jgi:excinuclease ABC subunit C